MNNIQLVQAAILLAHKSRGSRHALADRDDSLRQYWADSQCRLQRWQEAIHRFEIELRNAPDLRVVLGLEHLPMFEELIFADVLSTLFTGLLDISEGPQLTENPIGHNVLDAARHARQRTIGLLDATAHRNARLRKPDQRILQLCRGRQRAELWTDILIGYLPTETSNLTNSLGFRLHRVNEFRGNLLALEQRGKLDAFTRKLGKDVETYFHGSPPQESGNADLNQRIFRSIQHAVGGTGLGTVAVTIKTSDLDRPVHASA
jgi:hypothetical protein